MLSITHTLISLPFGLYLGHPLLIFATTFLFHLFADSLLHWNVFPQESKRYPFVAVAFDITAGLVVAALLLPAHIFTLPILAAIVGGNTPDVLHTLWEQLAPRTQQRQFKLVKPFFDLHNRLQFETNSVFLGLISQIVTGAAAIALVLLAR